MAASPARPPHLGKKRKLGAVQLEGPENVHAAAFISPGQSVGHLDFLGDLMIDGVLEIELEGDAAFDSIAVNGTLTLAANSQLQVSLLSGYVPGGVTTFDIATADAIAGNFDQLVLPPELAGTYRVITIPAGGGGPARLRLTAVPEPTASVVFAGALLLLAFPRRQSRTS